LTGERELRDWWRISLLTQVILAAYFQLILWLPLGKWNFQPGFQPLLLQGLDGTLAVTDVAFALCFTIPLLIFVPAYRKRLVWLAAVTLAGYGVWLVLQIQTWWIAYIFGASDAWNRTYDRVFSQSTRVLPSFGRHLPPDGMHLLLQTFILVVVISLSMLVLNHVQDRRRSRAHLSAPP
jgi:hypothetical protein